MKQFNHKHSGKWILSIAVLAGISISFLISCDSSTSPTPYTLPGRYFKDSVEPIFASNYCTSCHTVNGDGWGATGGADSGGLDLTLGHAYASLLGTGTGKASYEHQFSPDTIPLLRVKPGSPDSSYLYRKITKDDPGGGYGRMPLGGTVPDNEIAIIKKWIQYGAPLGDTATH